MPMKRIRPRAGRESEAVSFCERARSEVNEESGTDWPSSFPRGSSAGAASVGGGIRSIAQSAELGRRKCLFGSRVVQVSIRALLLDCLPKIIGSSLKKLLG